MMAFDLEPSVAAAVERQRAIYPRPQHLLSPAEVKAAAGPVPPPDPASRPSAVNTKSH
jgi:hypothetical protein